MNRHKNIEKYFQYGKSYLVCGHDLYDNIHIVNELIATIGHKYNEILYFDASPYGCYIEPQELIASKNMTYDIFGYFRQKDLTNDTIKQYHKLTALYLDRLFSKGKGEYQQSLELLLESIFNNYKGQNFSLSLFEKIIVELTESSKRNPYLGLTNILDRLNKLKEDKKDVSIDSKAEKLVFEARKKLEEYIYSESKRNILTDLNFSLNRFDKQQIRYYATMSEGIFKDKKLDTPLDCDIGKINYYNMTSDNSNSSIFLNLILETYLLKQKENPTNPKSLIILQSTQRELNFEFFTLQDLYQYADICYVEFSGTNLNKELNDTVPVKFYSFEHKNLGLKKRKTNKDSIQLEVSEYSIES